MGPGFYNYCSFDWKMLNFDGEREASNSLHWFVFESMYEIVRRRNATGYKNLFERHVNNDHNYCYKLRIVVRVAAVLFILFTTTTSDNKAYLMPTTSNMAIRRVRVQFSWKAAHKLRTLVLV